MLLNKRSFSIVILGMTMLISKLVRASPKLMSNVTLLAGVCPQVTFNCTAVDIPSTTLRWFINDDIIASYPYDSNHQFPKDHTITTMSSPWRDVVMIQIVEASYNDNDHDRGNFQSTLTTNLSAVRELGGENVTCGSTGTKSNTIELNFNFKDPSPSPAFNCSLFLPPDDPGVLLKWSPSFSLNHNITTYHVVINSTTSSCPSDQLVRPSEDYNYSGLVLGTYYSFTISAINCGNQEGTKDTFTVHPQAIKIVVFPVYGEESELNQLKVEWRAAPLSISEKCSFEGFLNFTVVLEGDSNETVEQRTISSDSTNCTSGLCSTSFFSFSSLIQSYRVSISAANALGESNATQSIDIDHFLQPTVLDNNLTFGDCFTTFLCSSLLDDEEICYIKYGRDPSYQNFDDILNGSLNSPSLLPLMDEETQYYFQTGLMVNSTLYQLRTSFTTGKFALRLTDSNGRFLIMGLVFLLLAIINSGLTMAFYIKKHHEFTVLASRTYRTLSFIFFIVALCAIIVSSSLWIVVGVHIARQKNTCDLNWQSSREFLVTSAFALSSTSLTLAIIPTAFIFVYLKKYSRLDCFQCVPCDNSADKQTLDAGYEFGSVKPTFMSDVYNCQICESENIFLAGGQHCSACGKAVCRLCSTNEVYLPYLNSKREVCDPCYEEFLKLEAIKAKAFACSSKKHKKNRQNKCHSQLQGYKNSESTELEEVKDKGENLDQDLVYADIDHEKNSHENHTNYQNIVLQAKRRQHVISSHRCIPDEHSETKKVTAQSEENYAIPVFTK